MKFTWKEFHQQLDMAMALWIKEGGLRSPRFPSKTSLMEFADYSNKKRKEEEAKK